MDKRKLQKRLTGLISFKTDTIIPIDLFKLETPKEIDWSDFFQDRYDYSYRPVQTLREELPERIPVAQKSVRDYLMEQLHLNSRDKKTDRIGEYIIDSLNEDGFLDTDVDEIAKVFNVTEEKVTETLKLIQTFDPPGVGSRTLEECLMVQLYMNGYDDNSVEVAIVKNFLREVGSKDINKIKKRLNISQMRVQEAIDVISSLNPKPLRGFGSSVIRYIIPDIIVKEIDGDFEVILNESTLPGLKINSYYREILSEKESLLREEKDFIKQKLTSALNLMRGLEERRRSILKVARFIIEKQKEFLREGISKLVPLTMQQVAEAVGLHESTISRIVHGKYIDTPIGLFELKFFFSGAITGENNIDISTRSIKERIKLLIEEEDKNQPLHDQEIVEILKKEGINIARRTVAKYRKQLGILPVRYRKGG
ncbi:MAG: RNA polymerase sigma-54 factor [Candidatus Cloacimonas sp. 4484_209]|nr:MAG: RNA polymerase sigma-54 factor [Candidatus Cloacimonas sp. 4484_209]